MASTAHLLFSSGNNCNIKRICIPAPFGSRNNPFSQFYGTVPEKGVCEVPIYACRRERPQEKLKYLGVLGN